MIENGNIKINGYYFKTENLQVDVSNHYHSVNTTKIFNGKEVNTRGEWNAISFSFDCFIYIPEKKRKKYNKIFKQIMKQPVEVISQDFPDLQYAHVIIKRQPVNANPEGVLLNFTIKEIPIIKDYLPDLEINTDERNRYSEK